VFITIFSEEKQRLVHFKSSPDFDVDLVRLLVKRNLNIYKEEYTNQNLPLFESTQVSIKDEVDAFENEEQSDIKKKAQLGKRSAELADDFASVQQLKEAFVGDAQTNLDSDDREV